LNRHISEDNKINLVKILNSKNKKKLKTFIEEKRESEAFYIKERKAGGCWDSCLLNLATQETGDQEDCGSRPAWVKSLQDPICTSDWVQWC
jgi:hypothetical protein